MAADSSAVWLCSLHTSHPQFLPPPTSVKHMLCITGKAGANAKSSGANNRAINCVRSHVSDPD